MDVIMAIVLTFLFYTNGPIVILAKAWTEHGLNLSKYNVKRPFEIDLEPHALPYGVGKQRWSALVSNGDILVPPCCFPLCCLAGREHVYSDNMVKKLITMYSSRGLAAHNDAWTMFSYL